MDDTTQTQTDTPVAEPTTNDTPAETTTEVAAEPETLTTQSADVSTDTEAAPAPVVEEEDDSFTPFQQVPYAPPVDLSQLPVDENGLIDANALAQQFNNRLVLAEQNAANRAQQIYAEQEAEKQAWDKAKEKYPELKDNKELRDMVHNARLGKVTELLSQNNDGSQIKFPSPTQMADVLFKYTSAKKEEGFKQATQNTVVQQSAVLETAGKAGDTQAENAQQAMQNINSPNKEVARKARQDLLKKHLGWE